MIKGLKNICNQKVFENTFNTHAKDLKRFLFFKTQDMDLAEDILQDTFIKLWENCENVTFSKLKSYLYTVANNIFLNNIKHQKVVQKHKTNSLRIVENETPEFLLVEKEFLHKIERVIESLPQKEREVFLLNRIEKKKYKEIAEMLNISIKTVEKRMHFALKTYSCLSYSIMKESKNINKENDTFLAKWLEGDLTDQELKNLVSEEGFFSYQKIKKATQVLSEFEKPLALSFAKIQKKINLNKKGKQRKLILRWSVSVAASILILVGIFTNFKTNQTNIATYFTEQKSLILLDGSEVILNAKSEISYQENNWKTNRTLTLDGEAYFKVKKGSTFSVQTNNGIITVLGTQFNVNSNEDYFEVTCFEGSVKVINTANEYVLKPGNVFRKINGNPEVTFLTTKETPSWIHGESSFKSVPLKYVILELEKQYNIQVDESKINDSVIFTGSFTHSDLKIALASVFKTLNIEYYKKNNRIFLKNRDKH